MKGLVLVAVAMTICCSLDAAERTLVDYKRIYDAEVAKIGVTYDATVEQLRDSYSRQLDLAKEQRKQEGDLAGVMALNKEAERFASERTVPVEPQTRAASLILDIQASFHETVARADTEKAKRIIDLSEKYRKRLETMKRQLVRGDKLDEAVAVDSEIKRVAFIVAEGEGLLRNASASSSATENADRPTTETSPPGISIPREVRDGLLRNTRLKSELVLYYPFGTVDGTRKVEDVSGNNAHGSLEGGRAVEEGVLGAALALDGQSYVDVSEEKDASLVENDSAQEFTLSGWFSLEKVRTFQVLMSTKNWRFALKGDATLIMNSTLLNSSPDGKARMATVSLGAIQDSAWFHVAAVVDKRRVTLFLNGKRAASGDFERHSAKSCLRIGRDGLSGIGGPNGLKGKIDEIMIWQRALSSREVMEVYGFADLK